MYSNCILLILASVVAFTACLGFEKDQKKVTWYDDALDQQIFSEEEQLLDQHKYILLFDKSQRSNQIIDYFERSCQYMKDEPVNCVGIEDKHANFYKVAKYLGVKKSNLPELVYLSKDRVKYRFPGIFNATLKIFVEHYYHIVTNFVPIHIRSEDVPATNTAVVRKVVTNNYKDVVNGEFLLMIYKKNCEPCRDFFPPFTAVANALASTDIGFGRMDYQLNEVPEIRELLMSFKTFPKIVFRKKNGEVVKFRGGRTEIGIIKWLKENSEYNFNDDGGIIDNAEVTAKMHEIPPLQTGDSFLVEEEVQPPSDAIESFVEQL